MRGISSIIVAVVASALAAQTAAAQWNVARFDTDRNRVYTTFGLDPAMIGTVGYGRVVPVYGHAFQLSTDVGVVTSRWDTQDFRARLGAQSSLMRWRSVHLTGSATFITRGTENAIYRGFNFGADVGGTLGLYRRRWFAAGEAGFDKAIVTHISHSDWYREHYYPGAKNGWYLTGGGTWRTGVTGGVSLGRMELAGRFGTQRTERFNRLLSPLYGSIGVGVGF